jgi:hypothetical protein
MFDSSEQFFPPKIIYKSRGLKYSYMTVTSNSQYFLKKFFFNTQSELLHFLQSQKWCSFPDCNSEQRSNFIFPLNFMPDKKKSQELHLTAGKKARIFVFYSSRPAAMEILIGKMPI